MKLNRIPIERALFAIVPALLLALVLQPAEALAQKITYQTDGHGYFNEAHSITTSFEETDKSLASIPTPYPADNYEFVNWTVDCTEFYGPDGNPATETQFTTDELAKCAFIQDATITANFKTTGHTVTYTILNPEIGHFDGKTDSTYSETVADGAWLAQIPTLVPDVDGYYFKYWYADVDLRLANAMEYGAGQAIPWYRLTMVRATSDINFTVSFRKANSSTIIYNTDGNGTFEGYEDVRNPVVTTRVYDDQYLHDIPTPVPYNDSKYAFDYWAVNDPAILSFYAVNYPDGTGQAWGSEKRFKTYELTLHGPYDTHNTNGDTKTITAHFKQLNGDVTYVSAGHGTVSPDSEHLTFESKTINGAATMVGTPTGASTTPEADYVFDYWTASAPVYVLGDSGYTSIDAGKKITAEQMKSDKLYVIQDTEFKAHFAQLHTVTYQAESDGFVYPTSEKVKNGDCPTGSTPTANYGYEFDYWTADADVALDDDATFFDKDDHITSDEIKHVVVDENITFTAHFKAKYYTVEYKTAGNGTIHPESEQVQEGSFPTAKLTATPDAGYKFDHWTANMDVTLEGAGRNAAVVVPEGDPITAEQREQIKVTQGLVLTAYFTQESTDPVDPDKPVNPDNPDGSGDSDNSGKVTSVGGSGSKLSPKTGDTLPAATVVVVLATAALLIVGAKLARKHCC